MKYSSRNTNNNSISGPIVMIFSGLIFVVFGIFMYMGLESQDQRIEKFISQASSSVATVVNKDSHSYSTGTGKNRRSHTEYKLYVDYTFEGVDYRGIDLGYTAGAGKYKIGDTVIVYFYPGNPSNAIMRPENDAPNAAVLLFSAFGMLFVIVAIVILIKTIKYRNKEKQAYMDGTSSMYRDDYRHQERFRDDENKSLWTMEISRKKDSDSHYPPTDF